MKTPYQYISLVAFLILGCQTELLENHYVSVIIDRSEVDSYAPDTDDIQTYLTNARPNDGITVDLSYISDTPYGSKYSFVLGQGTAGLLGNEDQRRKEIRRFHRQFKDSLTQYNSQQKPLRRSAIWSVVSRELREASKQEEDVTILLFSDLKEHSLFSVYDPKSKRQLSRNPKQVAEQLQSQSPLPKSLGNSTLRIMYQPSLEDAEIFGTMVTLYKELIESRGGIVIVGRHTTIEH